MERWVAMVARVEWRSERRGRDRPVALLMGSERLELTLEDAWVEGPSHAGAALGFVFVARDTRERLLRITARSGSPDRVEVLLQRA